MVIYTWALLCKLFVLEVQSWIGLKSICLRLVSFIAPLGKQVVEPVGEVEDGEEEREDEPAYHVDSLRSAEIHLIRNAKVTLLDSYQNIEDE